MIADMAAQLHAARLVTHDAAVNYDRRSPQRTMLAATAKLVASEMVGRAADATMQMFGGEGYGTGRPVERIWREVRAIRILEGTSEIMRNIIARDTLRESAPGTSAFPPPHSPLQAILSSGATPGAGAAVTADGETRRVFRQDLCPHLSS